MGRRGGRGLIGASGLFVVATPLMLVISVILNHPLPMFVVPFACATAAIFGGVLGYQAVSARVAYTLLQCSRCGYALRGTTGTTCPECKVFIDEERRRYRASKLNGPA